jgi:hypothetical protein
MSTGRTVSWALSVSAGGRVFRKQARSLWPPAFARVSIAAFLRASIAAFLPR